MRTVVPTLLVYIDDIIFEGLGHISLGGRGCCGISTGSGVINNDGRVMVVSSYLNIAVAISDSGSVPRRSDRSDIVVDSGTTTNQEQDRE